MSLDVVIEGITWCLIVLSSRNSDSKRRKWVCCAVQSSQLLRSAGSGFICCYPGGHWKQKLTLSLCSPSWGQLQTSASNKCQWCSQVKSLGFLTCLIKTSHPRKNCPLHFCILESNLTAQVKVFVHQATWGCHWAAGAGARGEFPVSRTMEHLQELLLHTSALQLKKDHAISFTEVNINFFVVVGCKAIFWQDWESLIYCCNIKCCWALAKAVFFQEFARHWFLEIIIYPLESKG